MTQAKQFAQILRDYNRMYHQLYPADCILVCGIHDVRAAERGIGLFEQGFAPYIIFSGGLGRLNIGVLAKPEAELFAETTRNCD